MLQKNLVYITLWLLLLVEINCQMTPFKPNKRYGHTATLIDNKLYILGGTNFEKDFFILMLLSHLILKIYHGKIY